MLVTLRANKINAVCSASGYQPTALHPSARASNYMTSTPSLFNSTACINTFIQVTHNLPLSSMVNLWSVPSLSRPEYKQLYLYLTRRQPSGLLPMRPAHPDIVIAPVFVASAATEEVPKRLDHQHKAETC